MAIPGEGADGADDEDVPDLWTWTYELPGTIFCVVGDEADAGEVGVGI